MSLEVNPIENWGLAKFATVFSGAQWLNDMLSDADVQGTARFIDVHFCCW